MKVLYVSRATVAWGAERSLLRVVPELTARGIEPVLAAPPEGELAAEWQRLGLPFHRLDLLRHKGLRRADGSRKRASGPQLVRETAILAHSVRRLRPLAVQADLVHSQTLGAHAEVAVAGRLAGRPTILQLHDLVAPGVGRRVLTGAAHLASAVSAITRACADCVGRSGQHRVTVIHNGLDVGRFSPGPRDPSVVEALGGGPGTRLVGILGRLSPRKQIHVLIDAATRLRHRDEQVNVVVVGRDFEGRGFADYGPWLREEARRRLGDRVRFVEPRDDVPAVMRALDVLVNASVAEPFGLTLLEAQACGTPVVATAAGGAPEFVFDDRTGLLVRPGDPRAMAAAIDRLLDDAELRRRLVTEGRAQAERLFTLDRQADEVAALYRRVIAASPSDRRRLAARKTRRAATEPSRHMRR